MSGPPNLDPQEIVLATLGAVTAVVIFLVIPRRRSNAAVHEGQIPESPTLNVVGGAAWSGGASPIGATWPLVRLAVFSWGIRIGPSVRGIVWLIPTTELRWSDIEKVEVIRSGVRFRRRSPLGSRVSFSGAVPPDFLATLRRFGVPGA